MHETNGHIAKFIIAPGRRDEAIEILRLMFGQVTDELGTLLYVMHIPRLNPDTIYFYERYRDDGAYDVHSSGAIHDKVLEGLLGVIGAPWEVHWLKLEFGKGLKQAYRPECGIRSDHNTEQ